MAIKHPIQKADLEILEIAESSNIIQRLDYDSLNRQEKDNVNYLVDKHNLTFQEAIGLIRNDEAYEVFKKSLRKGIELTSIELQYTLLAKAKEKAEAGFGETAQKLVTAAAILRDKDFGPPSGQSGAPMFNVQGKEVRINLSPNLKGWRPYQKK